MSYIVQNDVPVPDSAGKKGLRLAMEKLEVGQSFLIRQCERVQAENVGLALRRAGETKKFSIRKEGNKLRLHRTA